MGRPPLLPLAERPLAIIDTETTGLNAREGDEIIEIAIRVWYPGDRCPYDWSRKIMPLRPERIHPKAQAINGFTVEDWNFAGALPFSCYADLIKSRLEGAIILGQNPRFDIEFLVEEFKRLGIDVRFNYHLIDSATLAWEHLVPLGLKSLSLKAICEFLKIRIPGAHTALADVKRCDEVFKRLRRAGMFRRLWWRFFHG